LSILACELERDKILSKPRSSLIVRPPRTRSRVTNGSALFVDGEGNTPWARRWRDLIELHEGDLGGNTFLSEAQTSLCRRAATLEIQLEAMEGNMSRGAEVSLDEYARAASHLRRILETLGIERRKKDVTPTTPRSSIMGSAIAA
jgi:hypothetical protein